ncbi:PAS-domain containing protein [Pseudooceanicola aestuarii]|uniref:hybrid sensor histidine kinase/response regulator n=1 Tax=Pseudooceanicola aestuarii TaxID=2697319 RepID=UPI0013D687F5|nr:PAS-domain containing protein [Pseudooceanicola aestuarii]
MVIQLVNEADTLERQNEKLLKITEVLIRRVEQFTNDDAAAYEQFQRAVMLEDQVRSRTGELEEALNLLNESNAQLSAAMREADGARQTLTNAIETIREGFGLFDADDRLVLCNSRFGMFMPDIRAHLKPGLRFHDYIDHASRSRFIDLPPGTRALNWAERRRQRHLEEHVVFNIAITGDRWVQVSEHRTAAGQTVILQTDVTDIMRIERRERSRILDNQSRLIAATLEHLDQGVAVLDAQATLIGWNARLSELLGLPLTRLRRGAPAAMLLDHLRGVAPDAPDAGAAAADRLDQWMASDARPPLVFDMTRLPATALKVNARGMPGGGRVISFTDITSERQAALDLLRAKETLERRVMDRTLELEDALSAAERANASRSRFVAAASHDLLQPLSAARLFVSSLASGAVRDPATGVEVLGKISSALDSVEDMIGALLEMSKLETLRDSFDIRPVSLGALLTRLDGEFQPLAARKGIGLRVLPCTDWGLSDPTYLRRIIQNLIGNAIRYTATGRVLVGVRRRGPMLRIDVCDTGPGIPEDAQSVIFEEFQRLDHRHSSSEGLGLGLTIVDRACGALGHPLTLRSVVGRGSCFSVSVPRARARPVHAPPQNPALAVPQMPGAGRLVLAVDDDAAIREALDYALTGKGHHVMTTASVAEGLALLAEAEVQPDAIILDFQLGRGLTALDCLAEIRTVLPDVPICVLTANSTPDVAARCAAAGLVLRLKPARAEDLDQLIRGLTPAPS